MTIYEAIIGLTNLQGGDSSVFLKESQAALELGIEALKNEVRLRETRKLWAEKLLPGETRE